MKITNQNVSKAGTHLQKRKSRFTVARPTTTCNPALIAVHESLSHRVHIKVRPGNHLLGFTTKNVHKKPHYLLTSLLKLLGTQKSCLVYFNYLTQSLERSTNPRLESNKTKHYGVERQTWIPGRRTTTSVMKSVAITAAMNDGENLGSRTCLLQPRRIAAQAARGNTTQCAYQLTKSIKVAQKSYIRNPTFSRSSQRCSQMLGSTHTKYLLMQFSVIALGLM